MNEPKYNTSLNHIKNVLKKQDLLIDYQPYKTISSHFKDICTSNNLGEIYKIAIDNLDYNILLWDQSIIQFSYDNSNGLHLRYAYYPFPYDFPSYYEYLKIYGYNRYSIGETLRDEYDQALTESKFKTGLINIRYDYSEREYTETIHSISHFHIGLSNSIRLTNKTIITPTLFVIFILKQIYYDKWKKLIKRDKFFNMVQFSKNACVDIPGNYFSAKDQTELYFI